MLESLGEKRVGRNEVKAWRIVAALSTLSIGITGAGIAYDLYVLATHHLTSVHRISNVATAIALGFGAWEAIRERRSASAHLRALAGAPVDGVGIT